jgi:hypothetical protein
MTRAVLALATLVAAFVLANSAMAAMFGKPGGRDQSNSPPGAASEPTPYCKGYKDGFRRGYCGNDTSCDGETRYCRGERHSPPTYEAGYARGLKHGEAWRPPAAARNDEDREEDDWKDGTCDRCVRLPSPGESPQPQPHP